MVKDKFFVLSLIPAITAQTTPFNDDEVPEIPNTPEVTVHEVNNLLSNRPTSRSLTCPNTPYRAYDGLENGFFGTCTFESFEENTNDFEEVFEDCHGNAFPTGQRWFKAKVPFENKENAFWYAPEKTGLSYNNGFYSWAQAKTKCSAIGMPTGSHVWCPNSEAEAGYLWLSHPDQPFNPYPDTRGLWTGITTKQKSAPATYICDIDNNRATQTFLDWGTYEPHMGKQKAIMLEFMHWKMHDVKASGTATGSVICELNCDLLRPCEALDCLNNDATCVDNGSVETSECVCNDPLATWDRDSKTCSTEVIETLEISIAFEGMTELLQHVYSDGDDDESPPSNTRKRRSLDPTFTEITNHGCHCVRINSINTGLGGTHAIDNIDTECQSWIASRRCLTLQGGSCHNRDLSIDKYTITLNKATNEIDCSPNDSNPDQCVKDTCYVDAQNAGFIIGQVSSDPSWVSVAGDDNVCTKCSSCVAPAACRGVAPNVEPVSWVDFNQNGI